MDIFELAVTLLDTTFEVQHKYLPPLHAYAIFEAAIGRIDQLAEGTWLTRERTRMTSAQRPHRQPGVPVNPNRNNRLQPNPIK